MPHSMHITTKRLLIRDFTMADWPSLHSLYMKPETIQYNPSGYPASEQASQEMVKEWSLQEDLADRRNYTAVIIESASNDFVGAISLNLGKPKYKMAEAWFKLEPLKWNKGFATEALMAMMEFGFSELNLHRVECGCSVQNLASRKVMEKAGMVQEGILRKLLPLDNDWHDAYVYGILHNEFFNKQK